jgi:hypothetical protein
MLLGVDESETGTFKLHRLPLLKSQSLRMMEVKSQL